MNQGSDASTFINSVDTTFLITLVVSIFFLVLITGLMIYFVIRFNRKRNPKASNIHGNIGLEITWTVIPTFLVLIMFYFGWTGYLDMAYPPDNAYRIDVTAQMWKWTFNYSEGFQYDTLYVPAGKPVLLNLHSLDVNHAFFVPAFRIKKDVYPGSQKRSVWFEAKEGVYDIACAEYCGLNHSYMYNKVVALPLDEFDSWIKNKIAFSSSKKN